MEESNDCYVDIEVLFRRRRKRRKIFGEGEYHFFPEEKKNREKGEKKLEKITPKFAKDIEKSRCRFRSCHFCQFMEGFGIGFGEFGLG